jgi:hypothetical protein
MSFPEVNEYEQIVTQIPNGSEGNPYLHDVGIDADLLLSELPHGDQSDVTGLRKLYPQPESGRAAVRMVDVVAWAPACAVRGSTDPAALATLTDDFWLRVMVPTEDGVGWEVAADVSKILRHHLKVEFNH